MESKFKISIIIPTYNEADNIKPLLSYLYHHGEAAFMEEIIVADGQSTDETTMLASMMGARIVHCSQKGRAVQMNAGALQARGDILYFLHADSYPPPGFCQDIVHAVEKGYGAGCYRLAFDHPHWFLQLNCWFTRFDINLIRFGDQSLFVSKKVFNNIGGYNNTLLLMEDQEIIYRLKKETPFTVLSKAVITSARKYLSNGIYKLQGIFLLMVLMYKTGFSQAYLLQTYKRLIKQNKI